MADGQTSDNSGLGGLRQGCAGLYFVLVCYCIRRSPPPSTIVLQAAGCGTVTYHLLYLVEPIAQCHAVCPDDGLGADGDGVTSREGAYLPGHV